VQTVRVTATTPPYVPRFVMKQRITMMVNRYEVLAAETDGSDGQVLAFAEQKRMTLKEQVTVYSGPDKSQVLFSFKARKAIDLGAGYDVLDATGQPIGYFKKDFGKSLLRSSVQVPDERLDFRVAAAMTVALDAFQGR